MIIASAAGGMDIEEVAASQPEKILREDIDRGTGIVPFQARKLAFGMGLDGGAGAASWSRCSTRSTRRSSRPTPR